MEDPIQNPDEHLHVPEGEAMGNEAAEFIAIREAEIAARQQTPPPPAEEPPTDEKMAQEWGRLNAHSREIRRKEQELKNTQAEIDKRLAVLETQSGQNAALAEALARYKDDPGALNALAAQMAGVDGEWYQHATASVLRDGQPDPNAANAELMAKIESLEKRLEERDTATQEQTAKLQQRQEQEAAFTAIGTLFEEAKDDLGVVAALDRKDLVYAKAKSLYDKNRELEAKGYEPEPFDLKAIAKEVNDSLAGELRSVLELSKAHPAIAEIAKEVMGAQPAPPPTPAEPRAGRAEPAIAPPEPTRAEPPRTLSNGMGAHRPAGQTYDDLPLEDAAREILSRL